MPEESEVEFGHSLSRVNVSSLQVLVGQTLGLRYFAAQRGEKDVKLRTFILALAVSVWSSAASATVWYVDTANAGTQNGTSWATAYKTIQQGIDAATSGDEVWVAQGTYNEQRTSSATGSLEMKTGVAIYGGFNGTETLRATRKYKTNITIIDGSNGRGAGVKAYHVVKGADNATLDGFVVQNGDANGATLATKEGGGLNATGFSPTVRNCTFRSNRADAVGGALTAITSSAVIDSCIFHDNSANGIGTGDGGGGAIAACTGGTPVISNCLFYDNQVTGTSPASGGGAIVVSAQNPTIKNCTFTRNSCPGQVSGEGGGGAIIVTNSGNPTIKNCIMWADTSPEIALSSLFSGAATVTNCVVQGGYGGGTNIQSSDPLFVNSGANDFRISSGSPARNAGVADGTVTRDLNGTNRPLEAAIDEGAYEFDDVAPNAACLDQLVFLADLGSIDPPAGTFTITPESVNNASTDAGGIESYTLSQSQFTCADITLGTPLTVVLTVTDFAGNQDTCDSDVQVSDVFDPVITSCAVNQFVPVNGSCQAIVPDFTSGVGGVIADDNCGIGSRTQSPLAGSVITVPTPVTITVTDSSGNNVNCQAFAIPTDLSGPTFTTCPVGRTLIANGSCQVAVPNLVAEAVAEDGCGGAVTITQSPPAGTLITIGAPTSVTLTATDESNNTTSDCIVNIAVQDNQDPVFTVCPGAQTVAADASCAGVMPDLVALATATDNCGTPTVTQTPLAGTPLTFGLNVATLTAVDSSVNVGICSVNVTLADQTDPSITSCANDTTVGIGANCQAIIPDLTGDVIASDNCSSVTVTQLPTAGTTVSADTVVTLTVADAAGNDVTCTANVFIDDTEDPTITQCAPNTTVDVDAACEALVPDLTAQVLATDNCGIASVTQAPVAGTTISAATLVTFTVTDTAGNTATCSANVLLQDVTAPSITTCAPDQNLVLSGTCEVILPDFTASVVATDNCPGALTITQNPTAGSTINGVTPVIITVTDVAGNSTQCTAQAIASDGVPPVIDTCATDVTLDLNANCQVSVPDFTSQVTATDDCALTITQSPVAGTLINLDTTVTITVADSGGESDTCTVNITVQDVTGPVVTLNGPSSVTIPLNGTYTEQFATAVDNCDGARTVLISGGPVVTTAPNVYTLTYSASDTLGNVGSVNRTVTIGADNVPPTIQLVGPNSVTVNCGQGYSDPGATATDNIDGVIPPGNITVTTTPVDGPITVTSAPATYIITYDVSDSSNNHASVQRSVVVLDNCPLDIHVVGSTLVERAEGDSVTFEVTVTGAIGATTLQWQVETAPNIWAPAPGDNDNLTYDIANITLTDFARYRCTVSDAVDSDVSEIITLRDVNAVPALGLFGLAAIGAATAVGGALGLRRRNK